MRGLDPTDKAARLANYIGWGKKGGWNLIWVSRQNPVTRIGTFS